MQYDFNISFLARQVSDKFFESDKLFALENETGFRFFREEEEKYIIFIFEPNNDEPYRSIDIREFIKEHTNANNIKENPRELEKITDSLIKRSRGIIQERSRRSLGESEESRAEIAGDNRLRTRDRQLCAVYGSQIWNQVSTREERDSAEQLRKKVEAQKESLKQFQPYKQQALKSYQQNGVTLTPNIKNLQNEITSSLNKEDSQNNSSNLFSNFKNKLDNIHQNLANLADITFIQDTIKIDESKPQDNQKSQDSYLKTQHQIKRRRK